MDPILGSIILFAGNFAPRGWATCSGQLISIAQNTALFSLLGTTYGGDGRTTFGLPDLRGRAPIGFGAGPGLSNVNQGEMGGKETTTIYAAQMPAHSHSLNGFKDAADASSPENALSASAGPLNNAFKKATNANTQMHSSAIGSTGGSQPLNIRNPFLGLNYIIALEGVYPSRD